MIRKVEDIDRYSIFKTIIYIVIKWFLTDKSMLGTMDTGMQLGFKV